MSLRRADLWKCTFSHFLLMSLLALSLLLHPAPIPSSTMLDPNQSLNLFGWALSFGQCQTGGGSHLSNIPELFAQIMAMPKDQLSAGWDSHHQDLVGNTLCLLHSGVAAHFWAGGAGGGLTSWLNTNTRQGQGGLQGQPVVSEGQHICKGQQSPASGFSPGMEDAPSCVLKEQDRASHISSPWLCLGSLHYHSRFVQTLMIPLPSSAVFRLPMWPVVKTLRGVSF